MEANRRHKSFKGRLMMSLYRAPKPSTAQFSSKVNPSPSSSTASLGYVGKNEFSGPTVKQMASSVKKDKGDFSVGGAIGGNFVPEDSVDEKAAAYISGVQKRFKLEQGD